MLQAKQLRTVFVAMAFVCLARLRRGRSRRRARPRAPTIVLVHGAFADASSWNGVIPKLQAEGYQVIAVANPLRSLAGDSAYVSTYRQEYCRPGDSRRTFLRRLGDQQRRGGQ